MSDEEYLFELQLAEINQRDEQQEREFNANLLRVQDQNVGNFQIENGYEDSLQLALRLQEEEEEALNNANPLLNNLEENLLHFQLEEQFNEDNLGLTQTIQLLDDLDLELFTDTAEHANENCLHLGNDLNYHNEKERNMLKNPEDLDQIYTQSLHSSPLHCSAERENISPSYRFVDRLKLLLNPVLPNHGAKTKREMNILILCWIGIHYFNFTLFGGVVRDFLIRGERPHDIDFRLPSDLFSNDHQSNITTMENTIQEFAVTIRENLQIDLEITNGPVDGLKFGKCVVENQPIEFDFVSPVAFHSGKSVDFDVNNLQVNLTNLTHQRVEIYKKTTEIIRNILNKQCYVAHLGDMNINDQNGSHRKYLQNLLQTRIPKMEAKGWTILNKVQLLQFLA